MPSRCSESVRWNDNLVKNEENSCSNSHKTCFYIAFPNSKILFFLGTHDPSLEMWLDWDRVYTSSILDNVPNYLVVGCVT